MPGSQLRLTGVPETSLLVMNSLHFACRDSKKPLTIFP